MVCGVRMDDPELPRTVVEEWQQYTNFPETGDYRQADLRKLPAGRLRRWMDCGGRFVRPAWRLLAFF